MAFASLREFMARLEGAGRLVRVSAPVSPALEITEIHTRLLAERGPAVLFERVEGSELPLLANLFGTVERVAWGMNREPHQLRELGELLAFLKQPEPPGGWREAIEMVPLLKAALAMKPRTVTRAPCQEVVRRGAEIDLGMLPIQTCWPGEPAPLITWPLVVTKGPGGQRADGFNLGIYRMQVIGRNTTLMRWLRHRGGAQHHRRWQAERHDPLPAAAVIGADPGTILAAVTPVPDTMSEYQFAGLLRGQRVELVDCVSVPLKVPATAEIVLEGLVSLEDYRDEGPYGDHTGYYNAVEPFPVFTDHRHDHAARPDLPFHLHRPPAGRALGARRGAERGFSATLQAAVSGGGGLLAAARGLLVPGRGGDHQEGLSRACQARDARRVVVSAPVHVHQVRDRDRRRHRRARLEGRDLGDLDPGRSRSATSPSSSTRRSTIWTSPRPSPVSDRSSGSTPPNKWPPETKRDWGTKIRMSDDIIERVTARWADYGLPGSGQPIWK